MYLLTTPNIKFPLKHNEKATAVTWVVREDMEDVVQQLKAKGVAFEHYDMPGVTRKLW
ncbi:MAG TPA: hypothetical protein VKA95_11295 [Nitrososphaeraceae archaeon]|nr:hypothetical protein [Nitrososphaeraceae archaeon]